MYVLLPAENLSHLLPPRMRCHTHNDTRHCSLTSPPLNIIRPLRYSFQLVEALFKNAGAEMRLNSSVTEIAFVASAATATGGGSFVVTTATTRETFDKVVIAAPLERTEITFSGFTPPAGATLDRGFTDWHVTVLEAQSLAPSQFQCPQSPTELQRAQSLPIDTDDCVVLTTANGTTSHTPYVCVQPLGKHGGGEKAKGVWLVYSDKKLTDTVLDGLFVGLHAAGTVRQHWPYTFARLNPFVATSSSKTEAEENAVQQVQPVVLHPAGCINANAMESISSAMEISVIGGRNAAHLLLEQTDMV